MPELSGRNQKGLTITMNEKIVKVRSLLRELYGEDNSSSIDIIDNRPNGINEIIISANMTGLFLLTEQLINLCGNICENNSNSGHYHFDNAGIAGRCDIPIVIRIDETPYE